MIGLIRQRFRFTGAADPRPAAIEAHGHGVAGRAVAAGCVDRVEQHRDEAVAHDQVGPHRALPAAVRAGAWQVAAGPRPSPVVAGDDPDLPSAPVAK
jgi:hypothetical protein